MNDQPSDHINMMGCDFSVTQPARVEAGYGVTVRLRTCRGRMSLSGWLSACAGVNQSNSKMPVKVLLLLLLLALCTRKPDLKMGRAQF